MHALAALSAAVNVTHPGLGDTVAATVLATRAGRLIMIVAPSGCGKSSAGLYVRATRELVHYTDLITQAGLGPIADQLTGFRGTMVVDDLGKIGSPYGRVQTICTLAELVYSHFVERHASRVNVAVNDFNGSAVIACQPSVLKYIYAAPEWESNIADKCLRYYHLYRPTEPNPHTPGAPVDWHEDQALDTTPVPQSKAWELLTRMGETQWSRARTQEHMTALVRAAAVLDGRDAPDRRDLDLVWRLLRPMLVESVVTAKTSFEEGRELDSNLLCLLVEFASYGDVPLELLCRDYHLQATAAEGLILGLNRFAKLTRKGRPMVVPTDVCVQILQRLGVERYQKEEAPNGGDTGTPSTRRRGSSARGAADRAEHAPAVRQEHAGPGAAETDSPNRTVRRAPVHPGRGSQSAAPGRTVRPRKED